MEGTLQGGCRDCATTKSAQSSESWVCELAKTEINFYSIQSAGVVMCDGGGGDVRDVPGGLGTRPGSCSGGSQGCRL